MKTNPIPILERNRSESPFDAFSRIVSGELLGELTSIYRGLGLPGAAARQAALADLRQELRCCLALAA